jgi:hypothetical protein
MGAALATLIVPAAATAAPDRSVTLTSAAAGFAWDGPEAAGSYNPAGTYDVENCTKEEGSYCDQTLVLIQSGTPVTIDAAISDYSVPVADFDLYIYKSNAAGSATQDDLISESGAPSNAGLPNGFEESATVENVEPGYYLVNVVYYETLGGASYKGTVAITGATPAPGGSDPGTGGGSGGSTPPPPPPPPPAQPAPAPAPAPAFSTLPFKAAATLGSAKKAKKKPSLIFSATAGETITGLTVQLLSGKPGTKQKVVGTAKVATFNKGTGKVTLKMSKKVAKKLKKGSYTLASRGTVNGQALQVTQAVKIKK